MPNLYKQYFVHNEPDKTRVINSNDIVEKRLEKMAELKRMEQKTTDGNGFSAGIVGPDTDYVEEIDHTAEAKKEAEKILAEAHAQAETILSLEAGIKKAPSEKTQKKGNLEPDRSPSFPVSSPT